MNSYDIAQKGMMSTAEIDLLKYCVSQLGPTPVIANIGAGVGTSAVAMLEARPESIIFSFDIKPIPEERENVIKAGFDPARVVRVLGNSWEKGYHFPIQFDLSFIDGAHYDLAVIKDIETFLPKTKAGGYILFHDYNHRNVPGLTKIVDEKMRGYKVIGTRRYLIAFQV